MLVVALVPCLCAAAVVAQGPPEGRPMPKYPTDLATSAFTPARDGSGNPLPRRVTAAGGADFDRSGNDDLWFLAEDGQGGHAVHVLLANNADLGRFRRWVDVVQAGDLRDAATYRSWLTWDLAVAVDPAASTAVWIDYTPGATGDPRFTGTWNVAAGWQLGLGAFEIETGDCDGDGIDDLFLLRDLGGGVTRLASVRMGAIGGVPGPIGETSIDLPVPLRTLRVLDADGDGRAELAVHAPGIGVALFTEVAGRLLLGGFLPWSGAVPDLFVGDQDGDGRDDLGVVLEHGVVRIRAATGGGYALHWLPAPAACVPLASGRFTDCDADGGVDVLMAAARADRFAVHFWSQALARFVFVDQQVMASPPAGSGPLGLPLFTADVDGDGDRDLIAQLADASFVTLRVSETAQAPLHHQVTHAGPAVEGYIEERIDVALPASWRAAGITQVEVGVYMRDHHNPTFPFILWHLETRTADLLDLVLPVRLFYLVDPAKRPFLTSPTQFPGAIAVSGDTMLTVHAKRGSRRWQSLLVWHEAGGDENKSTLGVQWRVLAAPPLPTTDAELLPFQ